MGRQNLGDRAKRGLKYLEILCRNFEFPTSNEELTPKSFDSEAEHTKHSNNAEAFATCMVLHHLRKRFSSFLRAELLKSVNNKTMKTIKFLVQDAAFLSNHEISVSSGNPDTSHMIKTLEEENNLSEITTTSTQPFSSDKMDPELREAVSRTSSYAFHWLQTGTCRNGPEYVKSDICFVFLCTEYAKYNYSLMVKFKGLMLEALAFLKLSCKSPLELSMVILATRNLDEVIDVGLVNSLFKTQRNDGSWPDDEEFCSSYSNLFFEGKVLSTAFAVNAIFSYLDTLSCSDFFLF